MFVDKVMVIIEAGNGGDGKLSFRHEKFIQKGGPDGGDGGDGGDVIFSASRNQDTLAAFRYKKLLKAESGQAGGKSKKHGKSGAPLVIAVPIGTVIADEDGQVLADLTKDDQQAIIAKGGKGGFGNAHFTSSTRQAPRLAEKGEKGEQSKVMLELKMIADVGIVGLPNAGKSTLLATVSNAHPEVANYPFTTTSPNLGVVDVDKDSSFLFADIPGLIEGASQGKGLGDEFLRHVERTAVLLHLIDIYNNDVIKAYRTIQKELKDYDVDLSKRPQIVALTKIEGLDADIVDDKIEELKKAVPNKTIVMAFSSQSKTGVRDLLFAMKKLVIEERQKQAKKAKPTDDLPVLRLSDEEGWNITKTRTGFVISGRKIERFSARTDFTSDEAIARLRDIMRKMGIMRELERKGVQVGERVDIGKASIKY